MIEWAVILYLLAGNTLAAWAIKHVWNRLCPERPMAWVDAFLLMGIVAWCSAVL